MEEMRPVPVTVLSGFLGAGKTSVLAHILSNRGDLRIGVIVNDLAEVNVDARYLQQLNAGLTVGNFKELHAGCVCCDAGQDLLGSIWNLLGSSPDLDHIIVECSGVAQVTVVDAGTILAWLDAANGKAPGGAADLDTATGQLLVAQIEGADLILVNKVDRVPPAQIRNCIAALTALNPKAEVQLARFGVVSPQILLAPRGKQDQVAPPPHLRGDQIRPPPCKGDEVRNAPPMDAESPPPMRHEHRHVASDPQNSDKHSHNHSHRSGKQSDTLGIGTDVSDSARPASISSFVFGRGRGRPFHPQRLSDVVRAARKELKSGRRAGEKTFLTGVLRSKGLLWVATCMDSAREWIIAGNIIEVQPGVVWDQQGPRQEIVFIGTAFMEEDKIRTTLEDCLLTLSEMEGGPLSWARFVDPLILTLTTGARARAAAKPKIHGAACPCCDPDANALDKIRF